MDTAAEKQRRGKYGEGGIRELGPERWQISFYDAQGRRRRESFNTEAKARKALTRATTLRDSGKLDPRDGRVKIDALAEVYKTYVANSSPKSYSWVELVWRCHLEPFFGGMQAERITSDHLQSYIRERLEAKAATSTVNHELTVLKAAFNHGLKADPPKILRAPRFPEKLREPNPRSGFVTDEQYEALQAKAKYGWLRALLAVGYTFGFRRGELVRLRVGQVDLKARTIHLRPGETKNDKGRAVVMTEDVRKLLAECVKDKDPNDALFTWPNGRAVLDFRKTWRRLVKDAGTPGLLVHDLRRTAVRNMVRAGISKHVAKRISGHTTDSVFDRYDITDESDLFAAAAKLEARQSGPVPSAESARPAVYTGPKLGTNWERNQ